MFEPTSRYYPLGTLKYIDRHGREVVYVQRRFVPPGESMPTLTEVTVIREDRLDLIAARTLGPPDQFWRVCDANNALNPFDLTDEVGRVVRVAQPQFQEPA